MPGTADPTGDLPDGNGRIIHELRWNDRCLIAWGGIRVGGIVTVHLPKNLTWNGGSVGATVHCMPHAGLFVTWTWAFGYADWAGAILCKRCFEHPHQRPKAKLRPEAGWWAYARGANDEKAILTSAIPEEDRRTLAVHKILHMVPIVKDTDDDEDGSKRIVEV